MNFLAITVSSFLLSLAMLYAIRFYLARSSFSSGDTFFHLSISKYVRSNNWKHPSSLPNVTFVEADKKYNYLAYPPLLHYLTAIFPVKRHLAVSKFLNLVLMSMVGSIAAISVFQLTSSFLAGLFASFLVVFNLSAFELSTGFTPRPLGLFLYSLAIFVAFFFPQNLYSFFAAGLLVMFIALAHKFAVQVLVFVFMPFSILSGNFYFLLSIPFGMLLSIVASKGFYLKILKEHLNWLYFYSIHADRKFSLDKIKQVFVRNPFYFSILLILLIVVLGINGNFTNVNLRMLYLALIPLIVALLVSLPRLSFLGENYRYIEYGLVPVAIICSTLALSSLSLIVFLSAAFCVVISVFALTRYKIYLNNSRSLVSIKDISKYDLLKNKVSSNLLVFPQIRALEVSYFTDLHVIHAVRNIVQSDSEILSNLVNNYEAHNAVKFKGTDPYQLFETLLATKKLTIILAAENFELYAIN